MLRIRDYSITSKLTWMNMLVSGAALLLASGVLISYERFSYRQTMVRDLSVQSQIIGENCISALFFNDRRSAENTLGALRAAPHVTSAWIYAPDGEPFAGYQRDRTTAPPPLPAMPADQTETHWFTNEQLMLVRAIMFQGKLTAVVYLESDLAGMYTELNRQIEIGGGVLLASLLAAFLVSWVARQVVARPVQALSETAHIVSRDKNYAVRATPTAGRNEISVLIDAFNEMLSQIQERDEILRKTQDQLNLALTSAEVGTWTLDIPRLVVTLHDSACKVFGLNPGAFSGTQEELKKLVHHDDWEALAVKMTMPPSQDTFETEFRVIWPDGSIHTLATRSRVYRDASGKPVQRAGMIWDISKRKQAEKALSESEERYRFLFEANPHPMWIYDSRTLAFLAVNDTAVAHYGYSREEFLKMKITNIRPSEDIPELLAETASEASVVQESSQWRHRKKDGTIIHVEVSSHALPFGSGNSRLVLVSDVTERKKLEEQLRQAQKMEAVGRLAGGVAHDFNNLLTIISGYGQLVRERLGSDDPASGFITEVLKAGERATALTRQLLAFSRQQVLTPSLVDLNGLVGNTEKMLRRLIGEDIELVTVLKPGLGQVKADSGQIEQVIMNLALNSRDAMPKGGRLTLETANVNLDESYVRDHPAVHPGPYVLLAVSDTGIGMDAETQKRIFEPFFTTKEKGKGTGLGLAMVYGIVRQSGGHIWVYSELNVGTVFKLYFPRSQEAHAAAHMPLQQPHSVRGSETILLVEDEESLRRLVKSILQGKGYTVLAPGDVTEALDIARKHDGPIHLLLTDVIMPRMSGRDVAEQVTAFHQETKVVYMSGYTDDAIVQHGVLDSGVAFIQKPFSPDAIARKVREVLDASKASSPQANS